MKSIVATEGQSIRYYYRKAMVEAGVRPFPVNNLVELENKLEDKGVDCLIIDIDIELYKGMETIERINELFSSLYVIVVTSRNDFDFVKAMNDYKVFGIVSKLSILEVQLDTIRYLISVIKGLKSDKRFGVRVLPYKDEHNVSALNVRGLDTVYYAKVKNISRVAASLEFSKNAPSDSIIYKDKEVNLKVELGTYLFDIEGMVFSRESDSMVIMFRHFNDMDDKKLYEYILNRID